MGNVQTAGNTLDVARPKAEVHHLQPILIPDCAPAWMKGMKGRHIAGGSAARFAAAIALILFERLVCQLDFFN
jgi:hypothetical protein